MNRSSNGIGPFVDLYLGEFDDQDRVFGRQPHQRHQTDLEVDILIESQRTDAQIGAQRRHRQRQQHRQRHDPAFVLRGKEQENEQQHEGHHLAGLSRSLLLLKRKAAPGQAYIVRQVLVDDLLDRRHRLSRTAAGGRCHLHRSRSIHIKARDTARPGRVSGLAQCRKRHHRTGRGFDEEEVDVVAVRTELLIRLDIYAVDAVEHVEIVDIDRSQISFHRRENVGHRDSEQLRLIAVHIEVKLRNLRLQRRGDRGQFGSLCRITPECIHRRHQVIPLGSRTGLQLELDATGRTEARHHGRTGRERTDLRIIVELALHVAHHLFDLLIALFPRLEDHRERRTPLVRTHPGTRTGYVLHILHGIVPTQVSNRTFGHLPRPLNGRSLGHRQFDGEKTLIFLRNETRRNKFAEYENQNEHHPETGHDPARTVQHHT